MLARHCTAQRLLPDSLPAFGPCIAKYNMDVTIQHPWFKRALGPFYPSRLFDQFFGEGLFEYDLLPFLSSTISPYYRQSLFRTVLDSGISEVRFSHIGISLLVRGVSAVPRGQLGILEGTDTTALLGQCPCLSQPLNLWRLGGSPPA